jgi:hypothetical protein
VFVVQVMDPVSQRCPGMHQRAPEKAKEIEEIEVRLNEVEKHYEENGGRRRYGRFRRRLERLGDSSDPCEGCGYYPGFGDRLTCA